MLGLLAQGHSVLPLSFRSSSFLTLFFFRRLISEVAWPTVTKLCTRSMVTHIYEIRSDIWGSRNLAAQKHEISARFRTTSRLDREYLRNARRHRQSEHGVANYGHFRTGKHPSGLTQSDSRKIGYLNKIVNGCISINVTLSYLILYNYRHKYSPVW